MLLMLRLHQPKEPILEMLPILISKAIILMIHDNFNDNLEELYGIFGYN